MPTGFIGTLRQFWVTFVFVFFTQFFSSGGDKWTFWWLAGGLRIRVGGGVNPPGKLSCSLLPTCARDDLPFPMNELMRFLRYLEKIFSSGSRRFFFFTSGPKWVGVGLGLSPPVWVPDLGGLGLGRSRSFWYKVKFLQKS